MLQKHAQAMAQQGSEDDPSGKASAGDDSNAPAKMALTPGGHRLVRRAINELRRGEAVLLPLGGATDAWGTAGILMLPMETMSPADLLDWVGLAPDTSFLMLTRERAASINIALPKRATIQNSGQGTGVSQPVALPWQGIARGADMAGGAVLEAAAALAGAAGRATPSHRPLPAVLSDGALAAAELLMTLVKRAELLPAAVIQVIEEPARLEALAAEGVLALEAQILGEALDRNLDLHGDLLNPGRSTRLQRLSSAPIPMQGFPDTLRTSVTVYRDRLSGFDHMAVCAVPAGDRPPDVDDMQRLPLVRVHAQCFTGDLLGSLRCDCGEQLKAAIKRISGHPAGGAVIYLSDEGRGIGLANKMRAYRLQYEGQDTYAANRAVGFLPDERGYDVAVAILRDQNLTRLRLMTNNPAKLEALRARGIEVVTRERHRFAPNPHNEAYLRAKQEKAGHLE